MTGDGKLRLAGFMSGSAVTGDSWRHPEVDTDAATSFARYRSYAETLERGLFDAMLFYDNVLPAPDAASLQRNPGFPRWEPLTLLSGLAVVTSHIGLVGTVSTSFNEPYNVARRLASLDHLSGGRAGWNVVTSTGGGENFNLDRHLDHAARYERAHEFFDVVTGLWDSVADDALLRDKASGAWLDPAKIHIPRHRGRHFSVQGPLNAPRPIQGWPVIAQAGASEDGRELAGRIGEFLYTAALDIDEARAFAADIRARAAHYGRPADSVLILPGVSPFIGRTLSEAEDRFEEMLRFRDAAATLRGLADYASLGVDLSGLSPDDFVPLPATLPDTNSHKSRQSLIADWIRRERPRARDMLRRLTAGGHRILIGTPQSIADDFEEWFSTGAADGFHIMFSSAPRGMEDFVDLVVPELQRRGLFRTRYEGATLRENLGLRRIENRAIPKPH